MPAENLLEHVDMPVGVQDLDTAERLSIEGHRPLGLVLFDPRTGERVTV